jgi:UTP--glucose-1-phosphate uridylyltransferase
MSAAGLEACVEKMRGASVADAAIETFAELYRRLAAGDTGLIGEDEIEPVESVPDADALPDAGGRELLDQAAWARAWA